MWLAISIASGSVKRWACGPLFYYGDLGRRRYLPQALLEDKPVLAKTSEGRAAEVDRLIAPTLQSMGYAIVRVLLSGDRRPKLQIMIERIGTEETGDGITVDGITVHDCAAASRAVSALLDVEDPIAGSYVLEVSSPGIDRPLTRLDDFRRFAGFEARLETQLPIDGRRRFRGRLAGLEDDRVLLDCDAGRFALGFAGISKAKLVLTDDLVAASQRAGDGRVEVPEAE